jgi:hypothetical protein
VGRKKEKIMEIIMTCMGNRLENSETLKSVETEKQVEGTFIYLKSEKGELCLLLEEEELSLLRNAIDGIQI